MNQTQISDKVNELAAQVMDTVAWSSFVQLPLKERVFGVKFLATMAGDLKMAEAADNIYQQLS